jgi:uncharacterized protein YycO
MKHIAPIIGLLALVACFGCDGDVRGDYAPQVGDVLFQSLPHNELTDAIEGASKSPYSHCGIVVKRGEAWLVLEANGPGVREIELDRWIRQGRGAGFATYRFEAKYTPQIGSIVAAARKFLGKPYDIHYDLDDAKIYCSELIYKAFLDATGEELGTIRKLGELDWKPHEAIIRKIENGGLPLERRMITPGDMAAAKQLQPVYRKGI